MANTRVTWKGDEVKKRVRGAAARGLKRSAEHLLTESRKVVPHEDGDLERSGTASVNAAQLKAAVSYDTPYARRQHEELTWRHKAGRTAKYLERPLSEERTTMSAIMAAEIRRETT